MDDCDSTEIWPVTDLDRITESFICVWYVGRCIDSWNYDFQLYRFVRCGHQNLLQRLKFMSDIRNSTCRHQTGTQTMPKVLLREPRSAACSVGYPRVLYSVVQGQFFPHQGGVLTLRAVEALSTTSRKSAASGNPRDPPGECFLIDALFFTWNSEIHSISKLFALSFVGCCHKYCRVYVSTHSRNYDVLALQRIGVW